MSLAPPRWQRRAEARPQELLEAALVVFSERGYAATRIEEVARKAGVAKATVYLYYENKLELFKAVVRNSLVAGFDEVARAQEFMAASAREQLSRLLAAFMQRVGGSNLSGIPKLVIAEAGNFPDVARFYHDEVIRYGQALVEGVLKRGIQSGEFRPVDVDYAWRIVIAPVLLAIIWKHSFQSFESEPLDFERYLKTQLDLLYMGLVACGGEENK